MGNRDTLTWERAAYIPRNVCVDNSMNIGKVHERYRSHMVVPMNFLNVEIPGFKIFEKISFLNQVSPDCEVTSFVPRTNSQFNKYAIPKPEPKEEKKEDENEMKEEKLQENDIEIVEVKNPYSDSVDKSVIVSVLLFLGPGYEKLLANSGLFDPKTKSRISRFNKTTLKELKVLVEVDKGNYFLPGGYYNPKLDGEDVGSQETLINTATRNVFRQTGINLANCKNWFKILKYEYIRADGGNQTTHIFMPNVEDLMPSSDVWSEIKNEFSQAMEKELEPVKVLIQPKKKEKKGFLNKEEKEGDEKPVEEVGESVIVVSKQEQKQKSEEKMDDVNSQKEEKEGEKEKEVAEANTQEDDAAMEDQTLPESQDDTEQNEKEDQTKEQQETDPILELNPASLKVAELRDHLGSLGLDTKGLKKVLVERLTEYIDEKKASLADKAENAEVQAEQEKMEDDDEPVGEEEKKTDEPAEVEAKTEIEPKPEEEPEPEPEPEPIYELKEKSPKEKETIQKKYNLPEKPTILIQSKHNFKTASLFTLLNYGSSEVINKNYLKESVLCRIFETQMTSEICRELLQNEFAFLLLHGLQRQVEIFDQKTKQEKREKEEREAALQKAKEEKAKEEEEKKKKEAEEEKTKDD